MPNSFDQDVFVNLLVCTAVRLMVMRVQSLLCSSDSQAKHVWMAALKFNVQTVMIAIQAMKIILLSSLPEAYTW